MRRLVLRTVQRSLPRGACWPDMDATLVELGLDSLDRADLAVALMKDLAMEMTEEEENEKWPDVVRGDITLEQLIEKVEAMACR